MVRITKDSLYLAVGSVEMYSDLGAELLIVAEKDEEKIALVLAYLSSHSVSSYWPFSSFILTYINPI